MTKVHNIAVSLQQVSGAVYTISTFSLGQGMHFFNPVLGSCTEVKIKLNKQ